MSKLAILIPAYNAAPFIGDAIASLLRQRDAAQLDIIVVDDGSTDGTGNIVAEIARQAPDVRLIQTANQGISRARNTALRAITPDTDLLSMLDADDLSPEGRYARDVKSFADDPALGFLYGFTRMFRDVAPDLLQPAAAGPFVDVRGVQLGASLMRMDLAHAIGLFDESLDQGEDTDFLFRMFELSPRIKLIDDVCVYYRRHGTNVTNDKSVVLANLARAVARRISRARRGERQAPIPPNFFMGMDRLTTAHWANARGGGGSER